MTNLLGADRIAAAAAGAGFTRPSIVTAVAVAFAESGGDAANVTTGNYPGRDRGLWQINSYWHPDVTDAQAFDPLGNAIAAFKISNQGTNFKAWVAYTNGSYKAFVDRAMQGVWVLQNPTPDTAPTITVAQAQATSGKSGNPSTVAAVREIQGAINLILRGTDFVPLGITGWFSPATQSAYDLFRRDVAKYRNWTGPAGIQSLTLLGQLSRRFKSAP